MFRALAKYFGVEPDLDIEAQRAIVVLRHPMQVDWAAVDALVARASYTLAGVHLRVRGRFVAGGVFEVDGSGQRLRLGAGERAQAGSGTGEIAGRIDDWATDSPVLVVL